MKCSNGLPKCSNCVTHGQACNYAQGPKKPRPSNDRISRLEEENRQLHTCLASGSANDDQAAHRDVRTTRRSIPRVIAEENAHSVDGSSHSDDDATARGDLSLNPARRDAPVTIEFHGPSSVLFDEDIPSRRQNKDLAGDHNPLDPLSSALMAKAATQRQLESLHFSTHQLDTDGVEQHFAEELLSLFWKTANSAFLVVYRPAFTRDWASGGPYFSKLLLNSIYYNVSRHAREDSVHRYGPDRPTLEARFQQRFKELLQESFDQSTITTVQALLVMSVSLSALGNCRSTAWLYSGMAYRMIIDIGLHTNRSRSSISKQASEEYLEIRRRVFWSAFVIDKLQSFYHGRPASIQEADVSVPYDLHDHHDELEQYAPMDPSRSISGSYSPIYSVSNFSRLCRLSLIMNEVLNEIYRENKRSDNPDTLMRSLTRLNRDLYEWHNTVPFHLRFSPASIEMGTDPVPSPHTYAVTIMYYVLQILLHRPFVSEGHLQSALPTVALDSFSSCVAAANSIAQYLESFNRAHTFRKLPYFLFYASYVSATIHVRIAAQKQLETNAYAYLRTCFLVFDENAEGSTAAAKAKAVIQQLMDRMDVSLPSEGPLQSAPTPTRQDTMPQSRNAIQRTNKDKSKQADQGLDVDPGAGQLQEWDFGDLDFDAVIQSFDQPLEADGPDRRPQPAPIIDPQRPEEDYGPLGLRDDITNTSTTMDVTFDQTFSNDVLFGFDNSEPGDLW